MKSLPAVVQRWLAILLPPFALLVCCAVIVPKHHKLRQTDADTRIAEAGIQDYLGKLKAISDLPRDPIIATLPFTKQEQSDFLRGLTVLCSRTGNRIANIMKLSPPPETAPATNTGSGGAAPTPEAGALPPDVTAINSSIVFEGDFTSLRSFLAGLQRSQRLISMSDCRIEAGQRGFPSLRITLTITRYVDAPNAAGPATPASGSTPGSSPGSAAIHPGAPAG